MKSTGKQKRILLLMIVSQLLLVLFVGQWLRSQFNREKEELGQQLRSIYISTGDNIVDTILFRKFVTPAIRIAGDSIKHKAIPESDTFSTNLSKGENTGVHREMVTGPEVKGAVTLTLSHRKEDSSGGSDTSGIRRIDHDVLMRSVKMIVAYNTDSAFSGKHISTTIAINPDTAIFRKNFYRNVTEKGMPFNIEWQESADSAGKGRGLMIFNPESVLPIPVISVKKYGAYILGRIMPQIIFGFILILLTGVSFIVAYRSIRSQVLLNTLRDEFVSNITHELKTPVSTLSITLEALGRYNLRSEPLKMEEYLQLASTETKRLEVLINRILTHSQLESENQIVNFECVELTRIIYEVAELIRQKPGFKGTIETDVPDKDLTLQGDRLLLAEVLLNLIDNSIRYNDKIAEIRITATVDNNNAIVSVIDNGPGIPVVYHTKVFDKFFRVPTGNIHNVKGYGLGLAFVKQVVRLHGGSVNLRNLNPGCCFTFRIPLTK